MNQIGFDVGEYRGYQDTPEDRQIALQKLLKEVENQSAHRVERERIEAITRETGYWFEGIRYD